jgi:hypothetical protein
MTAAHTPGPWIVEDTYSADHYVVLGEGRRMVARVIGKPNVDLIAAAPQLADELRGLTDLIAAIRDEQTSAAIFGGDETAKRRENSHTYAGRIASLAAQIDERMESARAVLTAAGITP